MTRLAALPIGAIPELSDLFEQAQASGQHVPNSQLILQRKPKILRALRGLHAAVFDPQGEVGVGLKRLLGYVSSHTHGCHY